MALSLAFARMDFGGALGKIRQKRGIRMRPDTPILDANLEKRTRWFGRAEKPARVGWYECRYWSDRYRQWALAVPRWWDGQVFRFSPDGPASDFGFQPRDEWRGRTEP